MHFLARMNKLEEAQGLLDIEMFNSKPKTFKYPLLVLPTTCQSESRAEILCG